MNAINDRLHLASAISEMVLRYGDAVRIEERGVSAPYNPATAAEDLANDAKAFRRVHRRHKALLRLTYALALAEVNR